MPAPAVLTEQLTRTFGSQMVIDHIDLDVPSGAVYGVLGPMGAGKTTLVRLLLGLAPPTSGTAWLLGFDVRTDGDAIRARTGVVLQSPGLYENLTAIENLELYARIWHLPAVDRTARIRDLLQHLDLWTRRHERVAGWSPTMRHKLAILRALVHRPALLILDEPTAGLDVQDQELLRGDLNRLAHQDGATVLITTRDPNEAALCDEIAVLHQGRLLAHGTPKSLAQIGNATRVVIKGAGFTADLVRLVESRRDVCRAFIDRNCLIVEISCGTACASIVNLVVESGADIESVEQVDSGLATAYRSILEHSYDAKHDF
ncbi:ABC transporter ATP-binding protein [Caldilinea sp.]|uniref:ABC transporter ATP-binding protein n=1 Tax=Caldilinea sp. TaxID=2293560 RepID=UPI002CDEC2E6|nr:ABC transporter ATP-binding protein [Anaerolineales bacterium]HQY91624.1 ABC transporter ATP-binding protein [Caldilinea sp.]HRA67867.1 ABC transporter ATP-binding protein [Caldilinea sp.]